MSDFNKQDSKIDYIELRKNINKMQFEARKRAKPTKCIICGRNQDGFCDSHSVPKMYLNSIADNGMLIQAAALIDFDYRVIDLEKGVKKSGTFDFICNSCDNIFFKDYEDRNNIIQFPTDKMLAEIAVKNFLLQISKRCVEKELYNIIQNRYGTYHNFDALLNILDVDKDEYVKEFEFHKNIADNNIKGGYQILYWKVLPYTVPIAMQSAINMVKDLENNIINNPYDFKTSTRMQYLHLCIFPLKDKSVVIAFYHKRDKVYRKLRHQFNSISEEKQLCYLNYLVFAYTENFFISKKIKHELETNINLRKLSQESFGEPSLGFLDQENLFGIGYEPISMQDIPNFLLEEWSI